MRMVRFLYLVLALLAFAGCKDDKTSFPASSDPIITPASTDLYSVPNRQFVIKAKLTDDLGLRSVRIQTPDFYLDKLIEFSETDLVTDYDLAYVFLAPASSNAAQTYVVKLILTDVSGNSVVQNLTLHMDGDFDAPALSNVKPTDGSAIFKATNTQLNIQFDANDSTGIDSMWVRVDALGILEEIAVGGAKSYSFNKTYSIPSDLATYEIQIIGKDDFVIPNTGVTKINVAVVDGLPSLFLADVPTSTDLQADVFGRPEYFHSKNGNEFTFKYYADQDNKEIYLLGQESSFEPHCFGSASPGVLQNSITSSPIILPTKGYYLIKANPSELTYSVTPYVPTLAPVDASTIRVCGGGFVDGSWDPGNTEFIMTPDPNNPLILTKELNLNGDDVQMTITTPDWGTPFWRLDAHGVTPLNGGGNAKYPNSDKAIYILRLDTELERATLTKK